MLSYYKRWLGVAITHSLGLADLASGIVGAGLAVVAHYYPAWATVMNDVLWQIPIWAILAVVTVRLLAAPYWIAKQDALALSHEKAKTEQALIQLRAKTTKAEQQAAIDDLSEELAWAITHLLNAQPKPVMGLLREDNVDAWEAKYRKWIEKVSGKLGNRSVFTLSDQHHFDRLGFVEPVQMSQSVKLNWLLGQLRLKFDRLREVIQNVQQRLSND